MNIYPDYPPRVRVEWLIATSRVVLAAGALIAVLLGPSDPRTNWLLGYSIGWYLLYSVFVLALVWTPVRFASGWGLALHIFDLAAFSVFTFFTEASTSPFFVYFTFLVICGTLRWEVRGAVWTAIISGIMYAGTGLYAADVLQLRPFALNTFVIRSVHLAVAAALVAYLGAHHHRFQRELGRIVSWPRRVPRDPRELVAEILRESADVLEASRVLVIWEAPDSGEVNLAWGDGTTVDTAIEPEATYGGFVTTGLERRTFQANDVANASGSVVYWTGDAFRQRICAPVNAALQARFDMHRVQSWSLDGELVRGRLFALDKRHMRFDDLIFGDVAARLAASRLDSLYLLRRLRHAAALDERLRVARDIHDSLLQTAAGTALQLLAARRLLDRAPDDARQRLEEVQNQLEQGELEMRSFIRRLRPVNERAEELPAAAFGERLEELRRRVERQWELNVRIRSHAVLDEYPPAFVDSVYRIVQEGVLNAARHGDPSLITVETAMEDKRLRVRIVDDGRGFPFHGSFDLATLNAMNQGPLTLKERVNELQGTMVLRSAETGTELAIELPLSPAALEAVAPPVRTR